MRPNPRYPSMPIALAVALLLLFASYAAASQAKAPGVVVGLSGQATLTNPDSPARSVEVGDEVFEGAVIETGPQARVKLYFERDVVITCGPSTRLVVDSAMLDAQGDDGSGLFKVLVGTVRVLVGKLFGVERNVQVETPTGVAGVTGTTLIVRTSPGQGSIFLTVDGEVWVFGDDPDRSSVLVASQNYTLVRDNAAPSSPASAPDDLWDDLIQSTELEPQPQTAGRPGVYPYIVGKLPPLYGYVGSKGPKIGAGIGEDVWLDTLLPPDSDDDDDSGDDDDTGDDDDESDVDVIIDFPDEEIRR